jgi:hypothetical protein
MMFTACGDDSSSSASETTIQTACVVPGVFSSCMYTTSADAKAFLDQECTNTLQGTIASDCTGFPNCTATDEGMFMCEQ